MCALCVPFNLLYVCALSQKLPINMVPLAQCASTLFFSNAHSLLSIQRTIWKVWRLTANRKCCEPHLSCLLQEHVGVGVAAHIM